LQHAVELALEGDAMPLYWLSYRLNNQISVVIEPAHSLTMQGCELRSMD
jgi:hypothetical protein